MAMQEGGEEGDDEEDGGGGGGQQGWRLQVRDQAPEEEGRPQGDDYDHQHLGCSIVTAMSVSTESKAMTEQVKAGDEYRKLNQLILNI